MMNRIKYIIMFLFVFIVTFLYGYFISFLNLDEVWNYGFSYNIASGLIPYKDFNMLQTPLLLFIGSIFIKIFGHHLWSVHIFNSILISSMMIIIYKKINKKAFLMYPIILIYGLYSYNIFSLFLGIILLNCLDKKNKYSEYMIALLVSFIFLSKQNIGLCLLVPMIWFSKHKLKSLLVFLIPNLLLLVYLIYHGCVYEFIDYTFLGMFDFGKSNGIYHFVIFYVLLVGYLVYTLIKAKFKDKYIFYILAFQVVGIPIVDDYHFMIGFLLFFYYLLMNITIKKNYFKYVFIVVIAFFFIYLDNQQSKLADYDLNHLHLYSDKNSFLYGRQFHILSQNLLGELSDYVLDNEEVYHENIYLFSNWAFLIKMNLGRNLNKYDFILNGNMGYKGDEKIIRELNSKCSNFKCLFIVQPGLQINVEIAKYVFKNYKKVGVIKDIEHDKNNKYESNYMIYSN